MSSFLFSFLLSLTYMTISKSVVRFIYATQIRNGRTLERHLKKPNSNWRNASSGLKTNLSLEGKTTIGDMNQSFMVGKRERHITSLMIEPKTPYGNTTSQRTMTYIQL